MFNFYVENMKCKSCYHNIVDALKKFDSSIEVEGDILVKRINVKASHSIEVVSKIIAEAGYKAEVVQD